MVNCYSCKKRVLFFQKNYLENDKTKVYCQECKEKIDLQKQGAKLRKGRATCCVCNENIDNRIYVIEGHNAYYCKDHIQIGFQRIKEEIEKVRLQQKKEGEELDKKKRIAQDLVKKGFKIAKKISFFTSYPLPIDDILLNEINNNYLVMEKGKKHSLKQSFIDFSDNINLDLFSNHGFQVINTTPMANKLIIMPDTELNFTDKHPIYSAALYDYLDTKPNLTNKKYCNWEKFYSSLALNDKISLFIVDYGSDTIVTTKDAETGEYNRHHNLLDFCYISNNHYFILREIWVAHRHTKVILPKFDKTAEEIIVEFKDKNISSSLDQLFEFLQKIPIEEKEVIWDRGSSYIPEKIKFEILKIIPSNSKKINENTIIKKFVSDSGITNIFVNNTNIPVSYPRCKIRKVKSKPVLRKQKAIESFRKLISVLDLIGKLSYYEDKDEIIYFNEDFYFIIDKNAKKPKFK